MNKTLLLILCDFLLLNLLALTRWEKAEPPLPKQPPIPELAANAVTKDQDLVEMMRQSLADEKSVRDELAQKLSSADATLATREQSLTQLQAERARLAEERNAVASTLTETQRAATDLSKKYSAATQEASMTKEQLAQLQRELAEKQAEADRQRQALAAREKQLDEAQKQNQVLTMAVVVSEQEKKTLREAADTLKGQVDIERGERIKVQEANTQLAQGVGQLAEKSGELTKEIRDNRPINANVLFSDFGANRVTAKFNATRRGFLGQAKPEKSANTVLVTDGQQVYALMHIADTVFSFGEIGTGIEWDSLAVELSKGGAARNTASKVQFLAHDPRVVVVPLEPSQASALGARVYPLATEPFKFPEAVLIDGGGRGYGEVGFKLDPTEPGFVRVDNRFFKRLFGDFSPKRGDLVFAKTGELLGIMVNNDYCALLKSFAPAKTITAGPDIKSQATGALFNELISRVRAMPLKLQ
jgi:X-X-X-Leu-X-X-Gly heptad repeat protein